MRGKWSWRLVLSLALLALGISTHSLTARLTRLEGEVHDRLSLNTMLDRATAVVQLHALTPCQPREIPERQKWTTPLFKPRLPKDASGSD